MGGELEKGEQDEGGVMMVVVVVVVEKFSQIVFHSFLLEC